MKFSFSEITEKTMIPISALIIISIILNYIITTKNKSDSNAEEINKLESNYTKINNKLDENSKKLSRIEGILEIILEQKR